ncbi:glycosyltransferase family 4 protein [Streptomyces sp. V4I2]|uniref:glycosyltransferase family 4 protein n=1 Tax=Streptomyces sp. V4I2 TaxID=3042280 RepID=UPI0027D7EE3A|nr:glycosyltransferase family 4 protein [Streptomyces sp. V4I2]
MTTDDLNLRPARALAERLGGRYDVIVPSGGAPSGQATFGPVRLHRLQSPNRLAFLITARRKIDELVAPGGRSVLMSSEPLAAVAIEMSKARRRRPHLVHIQGEVLSPGPEYGSRFKRSSLSLAARMAVRRASAVRVVSRKLEREVQALTSSPVVFLGSRVDTSRFQPATPPAPQTPLVEGVMVGSLLDVKNHDTAIRAWARVVEELPHAKLRIIGDGPRRSHVEALVDSLFLREHVEFVGTVSHDRVPGLLTSARCFIHPSWSEGQPRAVLEGMACGLPVICSDISAHREMVPDVGRLVPPDDVEGWTAALLEVLRDPSRSADMGGRARSHIMKSYQFEANLDRYAELILAVATGEYREVVRT